MTHEHHGSRRCGAHCATCRRLRRATIELCAGGGLETARLTSIASTAGVTSSVALAHGPASGAGWISDAHLRASAALRVEFELGVVPARGWHDGMRWGLEALVRALVSDPAGARFCFVEARGARAADERVRTDWIALLQREYAFRHPHEPVPVTRLALAYDTIAAAVASHAREERLHELPQALEAVTLVAAGVG